MAVLDNSGAREHDVGVVCKGISYLTQMQFASICSIPYKSPFEYQRNLEYKPYTPMPQESSSHTLLKMLIQLFDVLEQHDLLQQLPSNHLCSLPLRIPFHHILPPLSEVFPSLVLLHEVVHLLLISHLIQSIKQLKVDPARLAVLT